MAAKKPSRGQKGFVAFASSLAIPEGGVPGTLY